MYLLTCTHIDGHICNFKVFMASFSVLFLCSELVGESVLSIQSSEKVTSISLPPTPPYHTLEFQLEVLCVIPSGTDRPANERLTNGEVRHRPRSYSHPDTPMTAIDQRVRVCRLICNKNCRFQHNHRQPDRYSLLVIGPHNCLLVT